MLRLSTTNPIYLQVEPLVNEDGSTIKNGAITLQSMGYTLIDEIKDGARFYCIFIKDGKRVALVSMKEYKESYRITLLPVTGKREVA